MLDTRDIQLFGHGVKFWSDLYDVLKEHNIKNAQELRSKLTAKPQAEQRVEVVDAVNLNRTLGFFEKRPMPFVQGRTLRMACSEPVRAWSYGDELPFSIKTVDFTFERKWSDGGWVTNTVLATNAPLEHLMLIDTFRLPDETKGEAEERRLLRSFRR